MAVPEEGTDVLKETDSENTAPGQDGPSEDVVIHKLVLKAPTKKDRGYLKRQRTALNFSGKLDRMEVSEKVVDEIIDFCLPYVVEPEDRGDAREALEWATEEEIKGLLTAISGADDAVPNRGRSGR